MRRLAPLSLLLALTLIACSGPKPPSALPQGEQIIRGLVKPTEISLTRRGTHILEQGGKDLTYLESISVDLRAYEGSEVEMRGTFHENIDPSSAPVFLVDEILQSEEAFRSWNIPALSLTLDVPRRFAGTLHGSGAMFSASGSEMIILSVSGIDLDDAPFSALSTRGQSSEAHEDVLTPIVVSSRRALRVMNESTGAQKVYIDRGSQTPASEKRIVVLQFSPNEREGATPEVFLAILKTVRFGIEKAKTSSSRSHSLPENAMSDSSTPSSQSAVGKPCGGEAGILCPAGQYCDVTDLQTNVGRCKKF